MSLEKAVAPEKLRLWDSTVPIVGRCVSSKFQAPSSREIPSSNFQKEALRMALGVWLLELLWCLDVGACAFDTTSANATATRNRARPDSPMSTNRRALPRFAGLVRDQFRSRPVSS